MTVCGAMEKDQVRVRSTSVMGMHSRDHGGMMSYMAR